LLLHLTIQAPTKSLFIGGCGPLGHGGLVRKWFFDVEDGVVNNPVPVSRSNCLFISNYARGAWRQEYIRRTVPLVVTCMGEIWGSKNGW